MRIWALLFQVNSLTFDSVVVAAAGKAFERCVAAAPASAAVQPSSSLHPGTVVDCKTVRIFAYSSTREQSNKRSGTKLKSESETGERR